MKRQKTKLTYSTTSGTSRAGRPRARLILRIIQVQFNNRRQAEPIRHLGVDEKAFRKGHKYMTVVNDLERGRILYVAEDRKQESLDGFWGR
jgi:transposase